MRTINYFFATLVFSLMTFFVKEVDAANLPTVPSHASQLQVQIEKMIRAGHLRPAYSFSHNRINNNYGYVNKSDQITVNEFDDVFHNPADTLYTLVIAYPHLSASLQSQVLSYIEQYYACDTNNPPHYSVCTITHIGTTGNYREVNDIPAGKTLEQSGPLGFRVGVGPQEPLWDGWTFNPFNFYALYKYAGISPDPAATAITILNALEQAGHAQPDALPSDAFLEHRPHVLNIYIAGYNGYQGLLSLSNQNADSTIQAHLDSALIKRVSNLPRPLSVIPTPFPSSDIRSEYEFPDPVEYESINQSTLEAGGFLWMTPELGDYLYQNARSETQWAIESYEKAKPYWSVPLVDEDMRIGTRYNEGTTSHLYDTSSLFLARAYAIKLSAESLTEYLDTPAYPVGDLFHIQNLVATINAPLDPNYTPAPTNEPPPLQPGDVNEDGYVDIFDFNLLLQYFGTNNTGADFNGNETVDIFDYNTLISNFGT